MNTNWLRKKPTSRATVPRVLHRAWLDNRRRLVRTQSSNARCSRLQSTGIPRSSFISLWSLPLKSALNLILAPCLGQKGSDYFSHVTIDTMIEKVEDPLCGKLVKFYTLLNIFWFASRKIRKNLNSASKGRNSNSSDISIYCKFRWSVCQVMYVSQLLNAWV